MIYFDKGELCNGGFGCETCQSPAQKEEEYYLWQEQIRREDTAIEKAWLEANPVAENYVASFPLLLLLDIKTFGLGELN